MKDVIKIYFNANHTDTNEVVKYATGFYKNINSFTITGVESTPNWTIYTIAIEAEHKYPVLEKYEAV